MRYRRRRQRLGRDFLFAMLLLAFGIGLPFATAVNDRRATRIALSAMRSELPSFGASVRSVDSAGPQDAAPIPTVRAPADSQPIPAEGVSANVIPSTLVPILPTAIPLLPTLIPSPPPAPNVPLGPSGPMPILMYHYIRVVDGAIDPLGYELSVAPDLFAQHMDWLAQNGYHGVTVDLLLRCMRGEPICPPNPVALTFDDGYADAYDAAFPVLQQHGFQATFYIITNFVGQPGYMTWEQVAALNAAGMEIGSHTLDHPQLTSLDVGELSRQITESRQVLEQRLGIVVKSFCYPVGLYDGTTIDYVRTAGYTNAVTTRWDYDYSDPLALPRRRVPGGKTAEEFGWIVTS